MTEAEAKADKGARKKLNRAAHEAEEALVLQISVVCVAEAEGAPQPYRASVARMW
jgi:hypothetical protein